MTHVWLFVAHVKALSGNELDLVEGSKVTVQCLIPETGIELALERLDNFLSKSQLSRYDLSLAERYDPSNPSEEYPSADYLRRDIISTAQTAEPTFAAFFVAGDSAWLPYDDKQHKH